MTRKYHLALMLIRKARGKNELTGKMEYAQNLAHVLAKASQSSNDDKLITVVSPLVLLRQLKKLSVAQVLTLDSKS